MLLCVLEVSNKTEEISITASFGVTTASESDDSLFDLMQRTDLALSDAKKNDRNTVRIRNASPNIYLKTLS